MSRSAPVTRTAFQRDRARPASARPSLGFSGALQSCSTPSSTRKETRSWRPDTLRVRHRSSTRKWRVAPAVGVLCAQRVTAEGQWRDSPVPAVQRAVL